jgi:hypothetical protein
MEQKQGEKSGDLKREFQKHFRENGGQEALDAVRELQKELAETRSKLDRIARHLSILEL